MDIVKALMKTNGEIAPLRRNSLLSHDAWKKFDTSFLRANRSRLVAAADVMSSKLVYDLGSEGYAITVLEYEELTNSFGANLTMSGRVKGDNFEDEWTKKSMPLPISSKNFEIDARTLASSKRVGLPLDTMKAAQAGKMLAEQKEDMLVNGTNQFTFGGGTIYGYTDFPGRVTSTMTSWVGLGMDVILKQITDMKQAQLDNKMYGPYIVYLPAAYETILDLDYNSTRGITLRDRILKIGNIAKIQILDALANEEVLLINMQPETVRFVIGAKPTLISWDVEGGSATKFGAFEICVPQVRADGDGNCGIVHYKKA